MHHEQLSRFLQFKVPLVRPTNRSPREAGTIPTQQKNERYVILCRCRVERQSTYCLPLFCSGKLVSYSLRVRRARSGLGLFLLKPAKRTVVSRWHCKKKVTSFQSMRRECFTSVVVVHALLMVIVSPLCTRRGSAPVAAATAPRRNM